MDAHLDDLAVLFDELEQFFARLKHIDAGVMAEDMNSTLVKTLCELLKALALLTKYSRSGFRGQYHFSMCSDN